jgi:hypothetical protein
MINVEEKTKRGVKMSKHRKQRDTWGKPNLAERFLYHTKIGRFYASFGRDDQDVIKVVVVLGSVVLGLAIYAVIALVS